jgi:hypothetical protein
LGSSVKEEPPTPSLDPRIITLLKKALVRDALVLAALYSVPRLRRWRRWYWRLSVGALALGALYGYLLRRAERRSSEVAEG